MSSFTDVCGKLLVAADQKDLYESKKMQGSPYFDRGPECGGDAEWMTIPGVRFPDDCGEFLVGRVQAQQTVYTARDRLKKRSIQGRCGFWCNRMDDSNHE